MQKHLEQGDLWDLAREDEAKAVSAHFQKVLRDTSDPVLAPQVCAACRACVECVCV